MPSYENSYQIDLSKTQLPTRNLTLARVSLLESEYVKFKLNLNSLLPQAEILSEKKTVMTPPGGVAAEFQWIDAEIYIPKTDSDRQYVGFGNIPELLSQAVYGTTALIGLIEVVNLNDDLTPIYYRREIGDIKVLPYPEDYSFVFSGVKTTVATSADEGILIYRTYAGADWYVNSQFNKKLSLSDAEYRPSKSILFAIAMHNKGFWVHGRSISEVAENTTNPLLDNSSATVNSIMENIWKLNPEFQTDVNYQVYHRAIHAYKMAFGDVPAAILQSILTTPTLYRGLAEYLIDAPNPPEPYLRDYIEKNIRPVLTLYGTTAKTLTNEAPGNL